MEPFLEEVKILRSRRRTLAIEITPTGEVLVRCPARMRTEDALEFVRSKAEWIQQHRVVRQADPLPTSQLQTLYREAEKDFSARTAHFAPLVGVNYGRITIRCQRSRWGSCSAGGNLNFNCLLMLAPPEIRDYVVVHELCHRRQMNHSPLFWGEVERVLPDYRECTRWLKENGAALMLRGGGRENG